MDNLDSSVKILNDNITRLFDLFSVASKNMHQDVGIEVLNNKLDKIIDQHDQIADAIVALKEIFEEKKKTPLKPIVSGTNQGMQNNIPREMQQPNLPQQPINPFPTNLQKPINSNNPVNLQSPPSLPPITKPNLPRPAVLPIPTRTMGTQQPLQLKGKEKLKPMNMGKLPPPPSNPLGRAPRRI